MRQRGRNSSLTLRPLMRVDLDFPVGDRARDVTIGSDQQPLADDEITLDAATHVSIFSRTVASSVPPGSDRMPKSWDAKANDSMYK